MDQRQRRTLRARRLRPDPRRRHLGRRPARCDRRSDRPGVPHESPRRPSVGPARHPVTLATRRVRHGRRRRRSVFRRPPARRRGDETTDDLGDLVEPRRPGSWVERCRRGVVARSDVAQDHVEERWMRVAGLLGAHLLDGAGVAATRRPLARLRRGSAPSASAVRSGRHRRLLRPPPQPQRRARTALGSRRPAAGYQPCVPASVMTGPPGRR